MVFDLYLLTNIYLKTSVMCLSSSVASLHHRVGSTGSLHVRKAASAQRLWNYPSVHNKKLLVSLEAFLVTTAGIMAA